MLKIIYVPVKHPNQLQQQNLNPRPVTSDLEQHKTFETEDVKEEEFDDGSAD